MKLKHRSKSFVALIIISSLVTEPAFSKGISAGAATDLVVKYGPRILQQIRKNNTVTLPKSKLAPQERSKAVEETYKEYLRKHNRFTSLKSYGEWSALGVKGGAALVAAYAGPQATVTIPVTLVAAAGVMAYEALNQDMEKGAQTHVRQYLKSRESIILAEVGLSLNQLRDNPEKAKAAFKSGWGVFKDLQERAGNDEAVLNQSKDLMLQALANTSQSQWDSISVNKQDIKRIEKEFYKFSKNINEFKKETNKRLSNLEESYEKIEGDVRSLEKAVVDLDYKVMSLDRDQAVIADFVLDKMSPKQKIKAIRDRGFLADRFKSKEGEELKTALINKFEKEVALQETLSSATKAVNALNTVSKIANDLGIKSPELNDAVKIGNAAYGVFSSLLAQPNPNYLGAISSLTGLFAKPPDPDAERFKILMGYLQDQFKQINTKLNAILENQVKIFDAISSLSVQMRKSFLNIEKRLARMEFEQKRISLGVRQLIWKDWRSCYSVYVHSMRKNGASSLYVDPVTLLFHDEAAMVKVRSTVGNTALSCLVTMQSDMVSLRATQRFGNFINLQWVIDERLTTAASLKNEVAEEWRSLLMAFKQDVFQYARNYFDRYIRSESKKNNYANNFARLTRPMASIDEWRYGLKVSHEKPFRCHDTKDINARLSLLLCPPGSDSPDIVASRLLDSPILGDVVNDISDWVLVMSQLADVRDQENGRWVKFDELLKKAEAGQLEKGSSAGELMIEAAISMVDLAIASYAMTYGPDVASVLLKDIKNGDEKVIDVVNANPFLAHNLAQLFLEEQFSKVTPSNQKERPTKITYSAAYQLASAQDGSSTILLEGLFGENLEFFTDDEGIPNLKIPVGSQYLSLKVPAPGEMVEGRIKWPARYYELLATREKLADRLIGYELFDNIDSNSKDYVVNIMTRPDFK